MADRVQPGGIETTAWNYEWGSVAGRYGGFVVEATDPTVAAREASVDESAFVEFDATHSTTSLTVTIGPGEAFVNGWVATDVSHDVTLEANTAGQTVAVGWNHNAFDDTVIIGTEDAFGGLPSIELWAFDTDGSGVTNATDLRRVGPHIDAENVVANEDLENHTSDTAAHGSNGDVAGMNDLFSGSHADLSNIGSSDHHSRYSDPEAVSALESANSVGFGGDVEFGSSEFDGAIRHRSGTTSNVVVGYSNDNNGPYFAGVDVGSGYLSAVDGVNGLPGAWYVDISTGEVYAEGGDRVATRPYVEANKKSTEEVQNDSIIWSEGFAPEFGG